MLLKNVVKYWNPKTKEFEGEPKYNAVNGLFDKYELNPTK